MRDKRKQELQRAINCKNRQKENEKMSHVATVEVQITDLDALKAACEGLGLAFVEGKTEFRWYGVSVGDAPLPEGFTREDMGKCDHCLSLRDNLDAYEVGVVRRRDGKPGFLLMYDEWRGGYGLEAIIGQKAARLKQGYATQVTVRQMRKKGYRVTQATLESGAIRLTCTR